MVKIICNVIECYYRDSVTRKCKSNDIVVSKNGCLTGREYT